MVTVEYKNPNGNSITLEVMDYQLTDQGALALYVEDGTQTLLSPQTEWVVRDE
jgi:hypothetical protein